MILRCWLAGLLWLPLAALAAAPSAAPFLWQVQAPGSTVRHYLLGSLHLLPQSAYPLPPALDAAYDATDGLVLESDLGELSRPQTQARLRQRASAPAGLKALLAPPLYARLVARAQALDMAMSVCEPYQPWFCAVALEVFALQAAGFVAPGLDQHFYEQAHAAGRPLRWLESPEEQIELLAGMSPELSRDVLAATLDDQESGAAESLRLWRDGDVDAMTRSLEDLRTHHVAAYRRLFARRNQAWAPRLAGLFSGRSPQLVIVGAMHLVGSEGVVALLRQKGFRVAPVEASSGQLTARR